MLKGNGCGFIMVEVQRWQRRRFHQFAISGFFDSFEGLPLPTEDDGVYERENYHNGGEGSIEKVKEISKYRFSQPTSSYNQGWFENTLRAKRRKLDRLLFTHRR